MLLSRLVSFFRASPLMALPSLGMSVSVSRSHCMDGRAGAATVCTVIRSVELQLEIKEPRFNF